MKTHDHAAQLAALLRKALEKSARVHPDFADEIEAALAAWDKHNAPAPKQEALL